jgi:MGT family glycosyltransferase
MTKYIFVNVPAHGHVNPTLPVVQELVARGETVIYYLTEEFRPIVEATGATFRPYTSLLEQMNAPTSFSASDMSRNALNIMPLRMLDEATSVLPQIIEEVRAEQPDCILYDMMSLTGKILARSLHVPAILLRPSYAANEQTSVMRQMMATQQNGSPNSAFSRMPFGPPMAGGTGASEDMRSAFTGRFAQLDEQLATLCQQYGVEPFRMLEMFSGSEALNIVFIPREFQPRGETFDERRYVFVGPSLAPRPATTSFPLEKLIGRTVLFISLGTVFNNQAAFFNACFAAFHAEPWLVVLSRGKRVDPAALDPIPSNFLVEPYVPQLEILQRASAFISHGGMNSTMESLYYGVPLVVVPQMPEQAMTAQRVNELGLGIMLDSSTLTPESLRLAVERVMNDSAFHTRVSEMQHHIRNAGGYKKAADAIISFASHTP